ncbi:MAG: AMP-binding protein, partial [Pseudomonadota bacterium]
MVENSYPVPSTWLRDALVNSGAYELMYHRALEHPESFWRVEAQRIDWLEPFQRIKDASYDESDFHIRWFEGGKLNVCANAIDRHLDERGEELAIIWEPDDPSDPVRRLTYRELHEQVCKFSNVLKEFGVAKGDRVTIYLPMVPEAAIAMLACARIGAVHSVVFAGFSPDALAGRIEDCGSNFVITADEGLRGGKKVPLKANVDAALGKVPVDTVIVYQHTGDDVTFNTDRDVWWHEAMAKADAHCDPEVMDAEDPLFILYTSGSTGKPKGVLHTTGGYAVWTSMTHEYVFDYRPGQIYWCAADVG